LDATTSTTVAIVGAGRVGRAMGRKLRQAGWHVTAVVTRSEASARRAVRHIGGGRPHGRLTRLVLEAGIVLIAVPDDAIPVVAARLARMGGEEWHGKIILHTSGALDNRALAPLEHAGASTGSIHPLQSFSSRVMPSLDGVWMVIEGMPKALRVARHIARDLGGIPLRLQSGNKQAYHAAGVFSAAHILTMVEAGARILTNVGFSRRQASAALLQLSRHVLSNFEKFGASVAWSGPAARGDFGTIAGHMRALKHFPDEYGDAYAAVHRLGARVLAHRPEGLLAKLELALRSGAKKPAVRRDGS
jgi:predicted short-subunit dehydrogenase-like oxidoreductase (DUF2520 family)